VPARESQTGISGRQLLEQLDPVARVRDHNLRRSPRCYRLASELLRPAGQDVLEVSHRAVQVEVRPMVTILTAQAQARLADIGHRLVRNVLVLGLHSISQEQRRSRKELQKIKSLNFHCHCHLKIQIPV